MMEIPQPAMAMNSHDVPGAEYKMTNTWKVAADVTPQHMMGWAANVFKGFKEKLPNNITTLIINCHGLLRNDRGGFGLDIGTGIRRDDAVQSEKLAPYCDQITITACQAAIITNADAPGDGNLLMSAFAKAAQAYVTASTADQIGALWLPSGYIDDWEGTVLTYGPEGNVVSVEYH
jgi:hypothetical protein